MPSLVLPGVKDPPVDEQRRHRLVECRIPHVPGKTRLEAYMEMKKVHERASGNEDPGLALRREDYPHWLKDHRKKRFQEIAKAAHFDSVATAKKDEVEHHLRMVNSDIVAVAIEVQNGRALRSNGRVSSPPSRYGLPGV